MVKGYGARAILGGDTPPRGGEKQALLHRCQALIQAPRPSLGPLQVPCSPQATRPPQGARPRSIPRAASRPGEGAPGSAVARGSQIEP